MLVTKWHQRSADRLVTAAAIQHILSHRRKRRSSRRFAGRFMQRKRKRARNTFHNIYEMLGPYFFKRAYRMSYESFIVLTHELKPYMRERNFSKAKINGPIYHSTRVACAIRYFAGGSSYDIATTFGISIAEVFFSIWEVVDALNQHPDLAIKYPEDHDEQERIAVCWHGAQ
jgi:hypothetical protein